MTPKINMPALTSRAMQLLKALIISFFFNLIMCHSVLFKVLKKRTVIVF